METELQNRAQKAWTTFFSYKKQLCNKSFPLRRRLQLFSEQRKMLRMMLQLPRRVVDEECSAEDSSDSEESELHEDSEEEEEEQVLLEDWVSWVRRVTHIAEVELQKAHVTD